MRLITFAAVLFCLLAAGAGYGLALWPDEPLAPPTEQARPAVDTVGLQARHAARAQDSADGVEDLKERLLFTQGRRPVEVRPEPVRTAEAVEEKQRPVFILQGTAVMGERRVALIVDPRQAEIVQAGVGDALPEGWTVALVEPRRALLRKQEVEIDLTLDDDAWALKKALSRPPKPAAAKAAEAPKERPKNQIPERFDFD